MPSFPDSIFLFVLALLLFGPKRLPVLARELGKWVGEFRRASNEFKMQMEEELRLSEQAERNKQIAAIEAAAPAPPVEAAAVTETAEEKSTSDEYGTDADSLADEGSDAVPSRENSAENDPSSATSLDEPETADKPQEVLPIAVSGDLKIMPPKTGLPVAQYPVPPPAQDAGISCSEPPLGDLIEARERMTPAGPDAIVETSPASAALDSEQSHGDAATMTEATLHAD
ncbi:MAG: twin-arginine translocase TatA/TatE family subunit [Acidobacteriota bacterium]